MTSQVKNKSHKLCKRRFRHMYPSICVPDSSLMCRFVKKVHSVGSFLDKECIRQNAALAEVV